MKVFITGISGMVGGTLANYFCSQGWDVSGLGRSQKLPAWVDSKCTYQMADIRKCTYEIEADVVIHCAALASDTIGFKEAFATNAAGTRNVLNALKKPPHFIYISSSSVYNFGSEAAREEDAGKNYENLSPYGQSKFLAEAEVLKHPGVSKITILRPRAIYGKNDRVLLPRLLKLVKGGKVYLPSNISTKISLTHVDNLVVSVSACIKGQKGGLGIYNVADNECYDLGHVLGILLPLVAGHPLKKVSIPAGLLKLLLIINNKIQFYQALNRFAVLSLTNPAVLSIEKIRQQIGFSPSKNFYNSYGEIIDWIQKENGWATYFKNAPG